VTDQRQRIDAELFVDVTVALASRCKNPTMPIRLPDPWRMTVEQLLELARSCRENAERSKNKPAVKIFFLALAERYQALVTERQKRKQD
jgi:hypothetical protein